MIPEWYERAKETHRKLMNLWKIPREVEPFFLTIGLSGEVGEAANVIKKLWRGDSIAFKDLRDELADVRIYLELVAQHFNVDLDRACAEKLAEVNVRWPSSAPSEEPLCGFLQDGFECGLEREDHGTDIDHAYQPNR